MNHPNRLSYGRNLPLTVGAGPGTVGFDLGGIINAVSAGANLLGGLAGKEKAKQDQAKKQGAQKEGGGLDLAGVGSLLGGVAGIANSLFGGGGGGGAKQPAAPAPAPAPVYTPPMPPALPPAYPAPPPAYPGPPAPSPALQAPQLPPAPPPPTPQRQQRPAPRRQQAQESPRRAMTRARIGALVKDLTSGLGRSSAATINAVLEFMTELADSPNIALVERAVQELEKLAQRRERREETLALIRAVREEQRAKGPSRGRTTGGRMLSTGVSMGTNGAVQHQNGYGSVFVQPTMITQNPAQGSGGYVLSSGVTGGAGCPWQWQNNNY